MRDKRPVDELSVEELERVLALRRREQRIARYRRGEQGELPLPIEGSTPASVNLPIPAPQQHESALGLAPPQTPLKYDTTTEPPRFEEEDYQEVRFVEAPRAPKPRLVQRRKARNPQVDKFLAGIELLAVMGLIVVFGLALFRLIEIETTKDDIEDTANQTQQELEAAIKARRATPTQIPELRVSDFVLPGGHIWDANGNYAFNYAEIESNVPASIRPAIQRQLTAPNPTSREILPSDPQVIRIPKVGVNHSIIRGDDWETLQAAVGHMIGSGTPGSGRNVVLTAHNDIYGEIFRYLPDLAPGDKIYIQTISGAEYTYEVVEGQQVRPNDVWVLHPTDTGADLTLITCYPYRVNSHRWVVFARQVNS